MKRKRFGIVGGLGPLASADIFYKIIRHTPASTDQEHFDIVFEQHPFNEGASHSGKTTFNPTARKLYVFNLIKQFEAKKLDAVILPCFISHTFLEELKPEIKLPVVNMMVGLKEHICKHHPCVSKLGVLTSNYVRTLSLFESYFEEGEYELVYPSPEMQEQLAGAVYGSHGIKAGQTLNDSIETIARVCENLMDRGAQLLIPGFTEIPTVVDVLQAKQLPIIDSNRAYAEYAIRYTNSSLSKSHRVGVVGGVGPAATVDFMQKIVHHTKAESDQDHIKLVVHHNPQIPDRTQYLVGDGADPTIQLFATCRQLENDDVDFIAIPCNTAHAFVDRLQRYLSVPIINMLTETVNFFSKHYPHIRDIGLLATSGTIQSRVYHDAFSGTNFRLIVPNELCQQAVMNAIYGEQGVKSGYTCGRCQTDLLTAVEQVVACGAQAVILGCTELPLLVDEEFKQSLAGDGPIYVDPTDILAQRCVELVQHLSEGSSK